MERFLIADQSEILVGRGLPRPLLPVGTSRQKAVVLTQAGAAAVADGVATEISGEVAGVVVLTLADREGAKTLESAAKVYEALAHFGLGRHDTVIGVGGGAITDAAGFIAGTWMRGVEVIHVPTTLLGAVDAAVGGKTALNVGGKNVVGVFWHPRRVAIDLDVLDALPRHLKMEGAAEIIKAGALAVPAVVDAYVADGLDVHLEDVVVPAIGVKVDIVSEDFTETGRRALLNLGHTIGHGIEYASELSHGESVSIGLMGAAAISQRRLGFADSDRLRAALGAAGLPVQVSGLDRGEVMGFIGLDKKRTASGQRMVLLEEIGRPVIEVVTPADLEAGLAAIGL